MNLHEVIGGLSEDGLQVVMVPTSHGASKVCANLLSQFEAEAVGVRLAQKMNELTLHAPEPESEDMDFDFEANEGYPERRPMSVNAKAKRKSKKKMQKASRRANR